MFGHETGAAAGNAWLLEAIVDSRMKGSLVPLLSTEDTSSRPLSVSLSVLTPVFNERHLLAASLGRVLQLESDAISRLELVAVDDCSPVGVGGLLAGVAGIAAAL